MLLGIAAFKWFYFPVYRSYYNCTSPLAIVSVLAYIYGGPGNCLSLSIGNGIYGNIADWDNFLFPMIAALIGVYMFDAAYRKTSQLTEETGSYPLGGVDSAKWQLSAPLVLYASLWVALVVAVNIYLGARYSLANQGSLNGPELDNALYQSRLELLAMAWGTVAGAANKAKGRLKTTATWLLLIPLLPYLMVFLSRQYAIRVIATSVIAYILMSRANRISFKTLGVWLGCAGLSFLVLSNFRSDLMLGRTGYNREILQRNSKDTSTKDIGAGIFTEGIDLSATSAFLTSYNLNRMSGLEFATAIESAHQSSNIPWMFGYHNWLVLARGVPRVIWPGKPDVDPKSAISQHFGFPDVDHLSLPFSSGYADGGIVGVAVGFAIMGVSLCLLQHWVWGMKNGLMIYLGSTVLLMNFEQYVLEYPVHWLRALAVLLSIDMVVRLICMPFHSTARARKQSVLFGELAQFQPKIVR